MPIAVTDRIRRGESGAGSFAVAWEDDLKVSHLVVADITARNAIAVWKRIPYMTVAVVATGLEYQLGVDLTIAGQVWTDKTYGLPPDVVLEGDIFDVDGYVQSALIKNVFLNTQYVVASQAAMLALTSYTGNFFIRTDTSEVFIKLNNTNPSLISDFVLASGTSGVLSVNGNTGAVSVTIANLLAVPANQTAFDAGVAANASVLANSGAISTLQSNYTTLSNTVTALDTYAKAHLGVQDLASNIISPTIAQNGHVVKWNNTNNNFELSPDLSGSGFSNPMTIAGDIIVATSGGVASRLAIGAATHVLTSDGLTASWSPSTGGGGLTIGSTTITGGTAGRLLTSGATVGELTLGTNISTFLSGTKPTTIGGYGITDFNSLGDARWLQSSTLGTGVSTALGINVGSAGSFVVNGGALGTPSSGVATNLTGLPISTGVSGLGTGVSTWLTTPSWTNFNSAITGTAAFWSLLGNAGTVDGTNFIGTTDNVPFNIRVNNEKAGRIQSGSFTGTFFGYQAGNVDAFPENTGFGYQALSLNASSFGNTAVGNRSLQITNGGGGYNTAVGAESLYGNTTGASNVGSGHRALGSNTTGSGNTGIGLQSLLTNTTGSNNTAIGFESDVSSAALTNATAIGNGAIVTASNTMQLGNASVTQVNIGTSTTAKLVTGGLQVTGGTLGANRILTSDGSGNGTWQVGATVLSTARTIGITTGDVTSAGSSFDGSANNTNALTIANDAVTTAKIINGAVTVDKMATILFKTVAAGTYTILEADKGYQITFTSTCTITLPNGLTTGHYFTVWNKSGGTLTFTATTTLNASGSTITSDNIGAYFQHIGSNIWEGAGAFGSGGVTNVSSANANATVATQTTTPVITIVNSPAVGGITITGTPSVGQTPIATSGTAATWQTPASGFSDPMTTRGDLIFRNASNTTARLAIGTAGQVPTSDGTDISWATPAATGWGLLGNASTVDGTNFVGTTDNIPLNFRANNQKAGRVETTSNASVYLGYQAGNVSNSNVANVGIGYQALFSNTSGNQNIAIGLNTLRANTTGVNNVGLGLSTLLSNTTGSNNMAIGLSALQSMTTGSSSVAIGVFSQLNTTVGIDNTSIGRSSMQNNSTGSGNTGIGRSSLITNTTGSNNTGLGFESAVGSNNLTNATAIGYQASVAASNTMQLGNASVTQVNIGTSTTATLVTGGLRVTGGTLGANRILTSDGSGNGTWQVGTTGTVTSVTSVNADVTVATTTTTPVITIVNSPAVGGITIAGTPSEGQLPTATSSSAATWQNPSIIKTATKTVTETLVITYGNLNSSNSASASLRTNAHYSNNTTLIADITVFGIKSDGTTSVVGKVTGRYRKNNSGTFSVDDAGTAVISDVAILASIVPEINGTSPQVQVTMGAASGTYNMSFTAILNYVNY